MTPARHSPGRMILLAAVLGAVAVPAYAQRGVRPFEDCTVQVLNQTVHVGPDGGWEVPNIPSNGGQVRARLHCSDGVTTRVGQSGYFEIKPNRMNAVRLIEFADPDPGPTRLTAALDVPLLTQPGQQTNVTVTGVYRDGLTKNLSAGSTGTSYVSTAPTVAAVTASGLIIAGKSGTAVITSWNEGISAAVWITVNVGADSDGDGLPDDYEIRVGLDPNDPVDALVDHDSDNLTALQEFAAGTSPFDADTDGDTISDSEEGAGGSDGWTTNPLLKDTDGDLLPDAVEIATATSPIDPTSYDFDAALLGLQATPKQVVLVYNPLIGEASIQLTIMGLVIDGSGIDLTGHKDASYESQNLAVAGFGATKGEIFAGEAGASSVSASVASHTVAVPVIVKTFTPQPLARIPLDCYGNGLSVAGRSVYVACGAGGLRIVSLDESTAPKVVGTLDTAGNADDVFADGDIIYIADGQNGLLAIDAGNPAAPLVMGHVDTAGDAWAIEVEGMLGAVADGGGGVQLVDLQDRTKPKLLGAADLGAFARDVDLDGPLAVAVRHDGGISVVDISNVAVPVAVATTPPIGNGARQVSLAGGYAFVATGNTGLAVVDLSDPSAPVVVGQGGAGAYMLSDVDVQGVLAFGADYYRVNSVPIIQMSIPEAPLFAGVIEFSQFSDDNGITVDADGTFVAMIGGGSIGADKGVGGGTNLFIGQHGDLTDPFGLAPTCIITSPTDLSALVTGARTRIRVQSVDDVFVQAVSMTLDGLPVATDSLPPFEALARLPHDEGVHIIRATAIDLGGNVGVCTPVNVRLIPDPLTTVTGRVVDGNGDPVPDVRVVILEENLFGDTEADGTFTIGAAPTYDGLELLAQGEIGTSIYLDRFGPFDPVPAGITDVGDLVLKTPIGSTIGSALVARAISFFGTTAERDGVSYAAPLVARAVAFFGSEASAAGSTPVGPVVSRAVTFFGSASVTTDSVPAGPVVARAVTFFGSTYDPGTGDELSGPVVARAVPFTGSLFGTEDLGFPAGPVVSRAVSFFASSTSSTDDSSPVGPLVSAPVCFTAQPVVFTVEPDFHSRANPVGAVTLSGIGFEDAVAVDFYTLGARSTKVVTTSFVPSADGLTLDVDFNSASDAPLGWYIIVIITDDGTSSTLDSGTNALELIP